VTIDRPEPFPSGIPRNIPEAELRAAVVASRSWRGVLRALGYTSPRLGRELRAACDQLQLDYSHFGPDEAELARAVATSTSWAEALRKLGYAPGSGSARSTVRRRCARAGVDLSHLETTVAGPFTSIVPVAPRDDHLRAAGPYLIAAALTLAGHAVSWAPEGVVYDLLVDVRGVGIKRAQVKTGTQRSGGTWVVGLTRSEYRHGSQRHVCYSSEDIDYFGCVDGDGDRYLIPIEAVEGMYSISVRKYAGYRLPSWPTGA
jgi:hypothetical protein